MGKWSSFQGLSFLKFEKEDLSDDRWGREQAMFGPFIVTEKGIFTDYFRSYHCDEMFFYYCPWDFTPGRMVRKVYQIKIKDRIKEIAVVTKAHPLFLNGEIHPDLPILRMQELQGKEDYLKEAAEFAKQFAEQYF